MKAVEPLHKWQASTPSNEQKQQPQVRLKDQQVHQTHRTSPDKEKMGDHPCDQKGK